MVFINKLSVKDTIRNIKRAYKYAKDQKKEMIIFTIAVIVLTTVGTIIPIFSAKLLISMTGGIWKQLILIAATIFAFEIVRELSRVVATRMSSLFFRKTTLNLQVAVAEEVLKLETKEIDNNSSGIFIQRLTGDTNDISRAFLQISDYVTDIIAKIGILFAILIVSKVFFIFMVLSLILLYFLENKRMKLYFESDTSFRKINEGNTGLISELIRGVRDIKVLNSGGMFMKKTKEKLIKSNNKKYEMDTINRRYRLVINNIRDSLNFIFILLGVLLASNNMLTISSFVVIYMYQDRVYNMLNSFTFLVEQLKKFNLSSNRVFEILENNKYKKEKFGNKVIKKVNGDFEFKNVNFGYKEDVLVLKNVNFKVKANQTVGFVGKSGGGKSTIFSLINKLYELTDGEIFIDGVNINNLTKNSIRDNMSIITQSPYIFNFTIKENLELVKSNVTFKEIKKVCKLACIDDFIMGLPDQYDTIIGEGGLNLSGGQRQRLAIARALLKKTEIILFDEATSALDNETQTNITNAINNMKGEYTILIVAHRLSTIMNCDKIFVIDNGKIVGEGTHNSLLKNNKYYKELYTSEIEKIN